MGSVSSNVECPRCKSENCHEEFWYKSGEEVVTCPDCGYYYSFFYKRDENGRFVLKDPSAEASYDNLIPEETLYKEPFAAYYIGFEDGCRQYGVLVTEEEHNSFVEQVGKTPTNTVKEVIISRYIDSEIKKISVWNLSDPH